jgi:preprotein translocase subunit SecE
MKKHEITQENGAPKAFDVMKWMVAGVLAVAAIAAPYYFTAPPLIARVLGAVVVLCLSAFIASRTAQGQELIVFIKGARAEARKVVWPTRQETGQATLIVVVVVLISALILWLLDAILFHLITWLTG